MKPVHFGSERLLRLAAGQHIQACPLHGSAGIELSLFNPGVDSLVLRSPRDFTRTDWRAFRSLVVDIENRDTDPLKLAVTMRSRPGEADPWKFVTFTVIVPPLIRAKWRIPLLQLRYSCTWGSPWGWTRQKGLGCIESCGMLDTRCVREVSISFHAPNRTGRLRPHQTGSEDPKWLTTARLGLYSMELDDPVRPEGWVDRYGQNSAYSFPGKVRSDSDIVRADRREDAELARSRPFRDRDSFQAWTRRPPLRATGFFRVEKARDRWWLVAPNGRLYFATGMDVMACGVDARIDRAVTSAHSWLPPRKGPFAEAWMTHGSRPGLSLYRANLIRKWGAGYRRRYLDRAMARQLAWGFTSIGNWSDHALNRYRRLPWFSTGPSYEGMKTPYVAKLIHDAFDPGFAREAMAAAARLAVHRDDPLLVGHFLSNEVGWNDFPLRVLSLPPNAPSRAELVRRLKRRYRDVWALNRAWGSAARSWNDLRWPADGVRTEAAERDMAGFRGDFADRWYGGWYRAIKAADPNHLVLGSRLNQGARPLDVIAACARHSEVVSFNHYDVDIWRGEFDRYYELARKPFLIGEYGHNSLDTGHLTAAVPVASRRERAVGYRFYTEQMAAMPYMVGGHFFQYLDEPATGRFDRETAFNGFVSVADIPHPLLVAAAKTSHARVYAVHAGLAKPFSTRPKL